MSKKIAFTLAAIALISLTSCGTTDSVEKAQPQTEDEISSSVNEANLSEKTNSPAQGAEIPAGTVPEENQTPKAIFEETEVKHLKMPESDFSEALASIKNQEENSENDKSPNDKSPSENPPAENESDENNAEKEDKIAAEEIIEPEEKIQSLELPQTDTSDKDFVEPVVKEIPSAEELSEPNVKDLPLAAQAQKEESESPKEEAEVAVAKPETEATVIEKKSPPVNLPPQEAPTGIEPAKNPVQTKTEELPSKRNSDSQDSLEKAKPQADSLSKSENVAVTEHPAITEESQTESESESITFTEAAEEQAPVVIEPSREVTVKRGEYLDVVYPGTGWVYLGENGDQGTVSYFGRKLGSGDTTFTFRSGKSGKSALHFYKNDALTGNYIDDWLSVEVLNQTGKSGKHIIAPDYASIVPPKPQRRGVEEYEPVIIKPVQTVPTENHSTGEKNQPAPEAARSPAENISTEVNTNIQKTESAPVSESHAQAAFESAHNESQMETVSDKSLLEQAKEAYGKKDYEKALSLVQKYLDSAQIAVDEALYLQGQIFEANSPVRNIRSAIDSYDFVVKGYPDSPLWKNANKRSIYLKRFYVDIR